MLFSQKPQYSDITTQTPTFTDCVTYDTEKATAESLGNAVTKTANTVVINLRFTAKSTSSYLDVANIASGYRPKNNNIFFPGIDETSGAGVRFGYVGGDIRVNSPTANHVYCVTLTWGA